MAAAYEVPVQNLGTFLTGEDDSSNQYTFVTLDSSGHVIKNTSSGANCIGVLQNNPANSRQASVMTYGVSKVVAGAALATPGTAIKSDTSGRAIAAAGSGTRLGVTLTTAAAAGDLVTVLLFIQPQ